VKEITRKFVKEIAEIAVMAMEAVGEVIVGGMMVVILVQPLLYLCVIYPTELVLMILKD